MKREELLKVMEESKITREYFEGEMVKARIGFEGKVADNMLRLLDKHNSFVDGSCRILKKLEFDEWRTVLEGLMYEIATIPGRSAQMNEKFKEDFDEALAVKLYPVVLKVVVDNKMKLVGNAYKEFENNSEGVKEVKSF